LHDEWEIYRQEVGRLIEEGHERKFVLIRDREIIGFCETLRDAHREGLNRFGVYAKYLIHQILTYERIYKAGSIVGQTATSSTAEKAETLTPQMPLAKSA
jgi:hypothetical protein